MADYFLALPSGDKYIIASERFSVRSNAERYAKRMGWARYFIATEEQKAMIESGQPFSPAVISVVENVTTIVSPEETTPDAKWMKEEGIPWNKKGRKAKKSRDNVAR